MRMFSDIFNGSRLFHMEERQAMTKLKMHEQQIALWAAKIYKEAQEYADIADPKRTRSNYVANNLDGICRLAREIQFALKDRP